MRRLGCLLAATLAFSSPIFASNPATITFDRSQLAISPDLRDISYAGDHPLAVGTDLLLSSKAVLIELRDGEAAADLAYISGEQIPLGYVPLKTGFTDIPTSDAGEFADITQRQAGLRRGSKPVIVDDAVRLDGRRYLRIELLPVTVDTAGNLTLHSSIALRVGGRAIAPGDLLSPQLLPMTTATPGRALSVGCDYVIITDSHLAPSFERLAKYRTTTGYKVEMKRIEDITAAFNGDDEAEKLREYLKTFYAQGGTYVLLGGDETVVPVRYAYDYRSDEPVSIEELQICDLYYGDLTGDWDVDRDGIWGERYDDRADFTPELLVGRLPVNDPADVSSYIAKLIAYETSPGNGDMSYLSRTFFFSSDEMRDYGTNGQHGRIAQAFPLWFVVDTTHGVEMSTGSDPAPTNPDGSEAVDILSNGYGIVNILAHGGSGGYTVRSSGYNGFPKSFIVADSSAVANGDLRRISPDNRVGFYYSLACASGGFDKDQPPFSETLPNMVQEFLALPEAGAVGFVAYSRWGWVGSSHLLQKTFFDTLFAHPDRPAIEAMNSSRLVYYYYRDLVLGQNFFGDPALRVYTNTPRPLTINTSVEGDALVVTVVSGLEPVSNCRLVASAADGLTQEFASSADGTVRIGLTPPFADSCTLAAIDPGFVTALKTYVTGIATNVDDDSNSELPTLFALDQNHPNPFNPTTTISFDLPERSRVRLEVFNVLGQRVAVLKDEVMSAGTHSLEWDGKNESRGEVVSGVYFYRLETDNWRDVRKMVLIR